VKKVLSLFGRGRGLEIGWYLVCSLLVFFGGSGTIRTHPSHPMGKEIAVSPHDSIELADEYHALVEVPRAHDYVLRTLMRREVNGQPLVAGELVIAGEDTRAEHPLANEYPLHFRKSYYPVAFFQDPAGEFERQELVSRIPELGVAAPIGFTRTSFRSCFVPGIGLHRLSPFPVEPEERNIEKAAGTSILELLGLWHLLEEWAVQLIALHEAGLTHGDLELHNIIITRSPTRVVMIDFENAVKKEESEVEVWEKAVDADWQGLLKLALIVQCGLGTQGTELGRRALEALAAGKLVEDVGRFERAIRRQTRQAFV